MASTIDELTDAATTALNDHDFGVEFTAFENFTPQIKRDEMGEGWHVWIVTADLKSRRVSRKRIRRDCMFDVGLIRLLPNTDAATVKPCLRFADKVQKYFAKDLQELLDHDISENDFDPLWSEGHLSEQSVFFSVLQISYQRHAE